jgi:oligoribonuclease NrnB/cAMP/cGMP phosphodiesterase (DHH superfamily)
MPKEVSLDNNGKNRQAETFKVCPNNTGILVGKYGTMKNRATGEVLEQILSEKGYWTVKNPLILFRNPREFEYVHRLIALTYVPGYSRVRWICHHKDNNPRNNIPENLIWS